MSMTFFFCPNTRSHLSATCVNVSILLFLREACPDLDKVIVSSFLTPSYVNDNFWDRLYLLDLLLRQCDIQEKGATPPLISRDLMLNVGDQLLRTILWNPQMEEVWASVTTSALSAHDLSLSVQELQIAKKWYNLLFLRSHLISCNFIMASEISFRWLGPFITLLGCEEWMVNVFFDLSKRMEPWTQSARVFAMGLLVDFSILNPTIKVQQFSVRA